MPVSRVTRRPIGALCVTSRSSYPPVYSSYYAGQVTISLSQGSLGQEFKPQASGQITQSDGGQFGITLVATNFTAHYKWHEQYPVYFCYGHVLTPACIQAGTVGHTDKQFDYSIAFSQLTIVINFKFESKGGQWTLEFSDTTANTGSPNPNIPSGSVAAQIDGCGHSHISEIGRAHV